MIRWLALALSLLSASTAHAAAGQCPFGTYPTNVAGVQQCGTSIGSATSPISINFSATPITLNGAPSAANASLWDVSELLGTVTSTTATFFYNGGYHQAQNYINCTDAAFAPTIGGLPSGINCLTIYQVLGTVSSPYPSGSRSGVDANVNVTEPMALVGGNDFISGISSQVTISANLGGTNFSGDSAGNIYGLGIETTANGSATFLNGLQGAEIDLFDYGGSYYFRDGLLLNSGGAASCSSQPCQGYSLDTALNIQANLNNGAVPWGNAITIGGGTSLGINSTGYILGSPATSGSFGYVLYFPDQTCSSTDEISISGNFKVTCAGEVLTNTLSPITTDTLTIDDKGNGALLSLIGGSGIVASPSISVPTSANGAIVIQANNSAGNASPIELFTNSKAPIIIGAGPFALSGNFSLPAWTTSGARYANVPSTITDTTSSGTVALAYTDVFGGNIIAASSATTYTEYDAMDISAPAAGTNVTFTASYALKADSVHDTGVLNVGGAATFALNSGTAATYACFTSGGELISSSSAC